MSKPRQIKVTGEVFLLDKDLKLTNQSKLLKNTLCLYLGPWAGSNEQRQIIEMPKIDPRGNIAVCYVFQMSRVQDPNYFSERGRG